MLFILGYMSIVVATMLLARAKGRSMVGWGLAAIPLSLLALLVILFAGDARPQCPECQGHVPPGAHRCLHCGSVLPTAQ